MWRRDMTLSLGLLSAAPFPAREMVMLRPRGQCDPPGPDTHKKLGVVTISGGLWFSELQHVEQTITATHQRFYVSSEAV